MKTDSLYEWRLETHLQFDKLWKSGVLSHRNQGKLTPYERRTQAYNWLRKTLRLSKAEGHISKLSIGQCRKLLVEVQIKNMNEGR